MLSPIAVQEWGCINFIGMSPTIVYLLLMSELSILGQIHRNVVKVVDVMVKVDY